MSNNWFNGTGTIGFTCDVCGRELQGCTWQNGMRFCAKCYQETFGNKNMTENLNNMYEAYLKILNEKDQRIAELEEQLKNAIVLPISAKQEIYYVYETDISGDIAYTIDKGFVGSISLDGNDIWFRGIYDSGLTYWHLLKDFDNEVFATKEEALEKLKELQGE